MVRYPRLIALAGCLTLALLAYAGGLHIDYYSDDFQFVFDDPARWLLAHFYTANPVNDFYRPLQASTMAAIQLLWGLNTTPLHLLHIGLHGLLGWVVWQTLVRLGLPSRAATAGSVYVLVQQAGALAVLSNDTLAQVTGTLFGVLCLTLLDAWLTQDRPSRGLYATALLCLGLALFSKETSVGFCIMIGGLLLARRLQPPTVAALRRAVIEGLPFVLVALFYVGARAQVVVSKASLGDARYQFAVGGNILKNVAMLVGAGLAPTATSSTFVAVASRDIPAVATAGASAAVLCVALAVGLWKSKRRGLVVAAVGGTCMATLPAALLNHVSEAYTYNLLPFLGLAVGLAVEGLTPTPADRTWRLALAIGGLGLVATNVAALQVKAAQMYDCGQRASELMPQVAAWAHEAPAETTLLFITPESKEPAYSVFLIPGYDVLRFAEHRVRLLAERPDLKFVFTKAQQWRQAPCPSPCVPFGFEHNAAIPLGEEELDELGR